MRVLAPVVLFVYNRPQHTQFTMDALADNGYAGQSDLYIFCDGAKPTASSEQLNRINEVRIIARNENRFAKVHVVEREKNFGLAASVIAGVTQVLDKYGKIIVLEDDHVTSPFFLNFMNDALDVYADNKDVACISGYIYPVDVKLPETFFIKGADCWGWATWTRGWELFEKDGKKLQKEIKDKSLKKEFDFEGTYPYSKILQEQIDTKNDSWAIRWYASAFLKNKYCLYPGKSLVQNIGIDGSGTHCGVSDMLNVTLSANKINVMPITVEEHKLGKQAFVNYFKALKKSEVSLFKRAVVKLRSKLK